MDQPHTDGRNPFDPGFDDGDALAALDTALVEAIGPEAAATVKRHVVCDHPAPALLGAVERLGADLLVVGARGLGAFRRLLLGSVSDQCVRHATRPTAVVHAPHRDSEVAGASGVHDEASPEHGRVVVGIDGSANADRALAWALDEGRARGATVEVVHAWQPAVVGGAPFALPAAASAALAEAAASVLDTAIAKHDTSALPRPVVRTLTCGSAP